MGSGRAEGKEVISEGLAEMVGLSWKPWERTVQVSCCDWWMSVSVHVKAKSSCDWGGRGIVKKAPLRSRMACWVVDEGWRTGGCRVEDCRVGGEHNLVDGLEVLGQPV